MKILLVDNHDSFTYNLVQLLKNYGIADMVIVTNDTLSDELGETVDAILVSPGPGLPDEAGRLMPFLHTWVSKKPILGICLGHQALGMVLGGHLRQLHHILHGETSEILLTQPDALFTGIPQKFPAGRYHSWVLDEKALPAELAPLCLDEEGHVMAFRHARYPVYGIQFHPESYMTPMGQQIIRNWLELVQASLHLDGNGY